MAPLFTLNPSGPKPQFEAVDALVDDFWSRRESLAAHLSDASERIRQLAMRNFEVLDELAAEKRTSW
jgi:hypothetical protein